MPEAELALLFLRPLNDLIVRYIVDGSVAAIRYGEPRFTNAGDVLVCLRRADIARLAGALAPPVFRHTLNRSLPALDELLAIERRLW